MTHPANTPASGGDEKARDALLDTKEAAESLTQACIEEGDPKAAGALQFISGFIGDRLAALAAQPPKADGGVVPKIRVKRLDTKNPRRWQFSVNGHVCGVAASEGAAYARAKKYAAPPLNTGPEVGGERHILADACKPWEFSAGDPPDYDSPLHQVFVAGMIYSERLLAGFLDVTEYEAGDGSEDFDNDATKSLENILTAAGLYDPEDGRRATLSPAPAEAGEDLAGLSAAATPGFIAPASYGTDIRASDGVIAMTSPTRGTGKADRAFIVALWNAYRSGRITPASRPAEQGEPVAWAYEYQMSGSWHEVIQVARPTAGSNRRNIRPLYAHPAPAASRPAGGRTDFEAKLKQLLHWHLRPDFTRDAIDSLEHEILCLLLNPSDDTRAGGEQVQEGGR